MLPPTSSPLPAATEADPTDLGRRERKRRQQRDHLANTAWALFEAEGYVAVTMERIAAAADVSKVTLYNHFPVKEALLRHVFHRELREAWPAIRADLADLPAGRAQLARFLALHADWCENRRSYLLPYMQFRLAEPRDTAGNSADGERSGMDRIFTALIEAGQAAGEFRTDIPAPVLAMHLQFAQLAALLRWQFDGALPLADEMTRLLDLVCDGMAQRGKKR